MTPNQSPTSQVRRITAEDRPELPCWLWNRLNDMWEHYQETPHSVSLHGWDKQCASEVVLYSHWSPNSDAPPTVIPGAAPAASAPELPSEVKLAVLAASKTLLMQVLPLFPSGVLTQTATEALSERAKLISEHFLTALAPLWPSSAKLENENEELRGIQSMHDLCISDLALAAGLKGSASPADIKAHLLRSAPTLAGAAKAAAEEKWQKQYALTCLYIEKTGRLEAALGNLVDAVNVEFSDGRSNIGGKTGPALIAAVDVLADVNSPKNNGPVGKRLQELRDILAKHLTAPAAVGEGARRNWQTGTPDVSEGKCETFWCCIEGCNGKQFHRHLEYANRHVMPLADGIEDAPEGVEPVPGSEEDFYWTGWHEASCDQCDTQWRFSQKVIAWMRLPKYALSSPPRPSAERTDGEPYAQWSKEAQLVRQEKLTSALWGFAHDLQHSVHNVKSADGTTVNEAAVRRAQEIILNLWGQRPISIQ